MVHGLNKMKKPETQIQDQIREVLGKYGKVFRMNTGVFKTADGRFIRCGTKGMSDLLFVGQGRIAWLECKTDNGKISGEQEKFIKEMLLLGHPAGIVRSVEDAINLINIKGDSEMFTTNYKDLYELISEGKYEAIIDSASLDYTYFGTEYIKMPLVIRNDVEQNFQNIFIWHTIWKKKEPEECDLECDGYPVKQLQKICKACGVPENKEFKDLKDLLDFFVGKPVLVGVKHETYNDKKQVKVTFFAPTKFPEVKHEYKKSEPESQQVSAAKASNVIEEDDLAF